MTIVDGEFVEDSEANILEAMVADAKEYWGSDLADGQESFVRALYAPVARRFNQAQQDIGLVLESAQIDHAEGRALDYLTALIGVNRQPSRKATGSARFMRDSASSTHDYTIPRGTIVQTEGTDPIRFETTESATLAVDTTHVEVPIKERDGGIRGNVGANTLRVMPSPPSGIDAVTNPEATDGGRDEETDPELRERAKKQLSAGSRASPDALISAVQLIEGVKSVSIFINDTDTTDADGLPPHSFEMVIEGGDGETIAEVIGETMAAGTTCYSGAFGTTEGPYDVPLVNGQSIQIPISRPDTTQVYVSATLVTDDEYEGDEAVQNSIINYIGGVLTTGSTVSGELGVSEDVIIGEIEYAIRSVQGVYDVTDLTIALDVAPTSSDTTNLTIADNQVATADANDGSITITS